MKNFTVFSFLSGHVLALILLSFGNAQASGFAVPEKSASGVGMSNALTANIHDVGAIPYNPSLGAFHDSASVSGHMLAIQAKVAVTPEGGSYTESQGRDHVFVPGLAINIPFEDKYAFNLNVNVPLGSETKWSAGTFSSSSAPNSPIVRLAHPTESRLEVVRMSPSLAFKLGENSALAFGIDHYKVKTVILDAVAKQNSLDGDGWGLNASLTHRITPQLTFGADYHSIGSIDARGETTLVANGTSGYARLHNISTPWSLQLGLALEVTPDFMMEFDFTRTGWSTYRVLEIESVSPTTSDNYWENADAYHFGFKYELSNHLRFRAGYTYDQTPQGDNYFSARSPDSDRHLFSIGVGYDVGEDLTLDVGYMYVKLEDRTVASTASVTSTELNGTDTYNGVYETDAHLLGVSLTQKF